MTRNSLPGSAPLQRGPLLYFENQGERRYLIGGRNLKSKFGHKSGKNPLFCFAFGVLYSFTSPERFEKPLNCSLGAVYC